MGGGALPRRLEAYLNALARGISDANDSEWDYQKYSSKQRFDLGKRYTCRHDNTCDESLTQWPIASVQNTVQRLVRTLRFGRAVEFSHTAGSLPQVRF